MARSETSLRFTFGDGGCKLSELSGVTRSRLYRKDHIVRVPIVRPRVAAVKKIGAQKMNPKETWAKTLEDGQKVNFTYQELGPSEVEITAQVEGDEIVQGMKKIVGLPLSHDEVEKQFAPSNLMRKPREGAKKPCNCGDCDGTMTYSRIGGIPGSRAGIGLPDSSVIWGGPMSPSWRCDKNHDHYELAS